MSKGPWREGRRAWERLSVWYDDRGAASGSKDSEPDPLAALGDIGLVRRLLDEAELRAVSRARLRGKSWAEIATRLGVTRQSAWERWRDLDVDERRAPVERPDATDWTGTGPTTAELERLVRERARRARDAAVDGLTEDIGSTAARRRRSASTPVPNVVGMHLEDAQRVLAEHHLMAVGADPDSPPLDMISSPGAVVTDQSPESGAVVPRASQVKLWYDRGEGGVREPRRPGPQPQTGRKMLNLPPEEVEAVG